jgi:hypothetical protein
MATQTVSIKICIGLVGICIVSIEGDEFDLVFDHIMRLGAEFWYKALPAHNRPTEGIYTLHCNVIQQPKGLEYVVTSANTNP